MSRRGPPPPALDVRQLEWTDEHIARFWAYWGQRDDEHYFSSYLRDALTMLLAVQVDPSSSRVLDYGGGGGHLTEALLGEGATVGFVDRSAPAVAAAAARFGGHPRFVGASDAPTYRDDVWGERFDAAYLVETLEHLRDDVRPQVLDAVRGFLRPGGRLIVTVPHDEDLRADTSYCPQCQLEWHRWQHVSSWTAPRLRDTLEAAGFSVDWCRDVDLERFQKRAKDRPQRLREVPLWGAYYVAREVDRRLHWPLPRQPWLNWRAWRGGPNLVAFARVR